MIPQGQPQPMPGAGGPPPQMAPKAPAISADPIITIQIHKSQFDALKNMVTLLAHLLQVGGSKAESDLAGHTGTGNPPGMAMGGGGRPQMTGSQTPSKSG